MKYTFHINKPQLQYIDISVELKATGKETVLYFPAWRPGRYELGDFVKNVNHFEVFNEKGEPLNYHKTNKNTWSVNSAGSTRLLVKYSYYAAELNAGSTFLDETQLYVNPVNCCLFTDEEYNEPITVQLNVPEEWEVAHSLKVENNTFKAQNYDELVDAPFICSSNLQKNKFVVDNTTFYIWFNGLVKPDWDKMIKDFTAFTKRQFQAFGSFPTTEYHYLIQILPYKAYHGVEHSQSTVITLGPSYAIFEEYYTELLGVSSHELYHTWNVKAIRPIEWTPYDFKKENYSRLGYIAEGVTTYMGDLMLFKSGVFDKKQYFIEMEAQLQKHFDNFGRLNYSVADSSFDTWIDGYVAGAPGRKVSIYTEGCLIAFMTDIHILRSTGNTKNLDDVMRNLYEKYGVRQIGITEEIYQNEIEKVAGKSLQNIFDNYVNGTKDYEKELKECFQYLGIEIDTNPSESEFAAYLGAKLESNQEPRIVALYPGSPLEKAGAMLQDKIVAINNIEVKGDADRWARFFKGEQKEITISRGGKIFQLKVKEKEEVYYKRYSLLQLPENQCTEEQKQNFIAWSK